MAVAITLIAVVPAVFWPGLNGGFLFDDFPNLVRDPDWKLTSWTSAQIRRALLHGGSSPSGRPLALLSFAAQHYFTGVNPFWLKAGNLFLHTINSVLVYIVGRQILNIARYQRAGWLAFAIAMLWALHPIQVSSVLYVVQRMELGAGTGCLAALVCYLNVRTKPQASGASRIGWLALAAVALTTGLLFKETAILACGYAFLLEVFLLGFRKAGTRELSRPWIGFYVAGFFVGTVLLLRWVPPMLQPDGLYAIRNFSLAERLLTQPRVLSMYLGQMLWPDPRSLGFYYDDFPVSKGLLAPASTLWAISLLVALFVAALVARKRLPLMGLGICWFLTAHVITSGPLPLELAFEHRNYLALFGVLLVVIPAIASLLRAFGEALPRVALTTLICALAFLSNLQSRIWAKPLTLAMTLESSSPTSQRASYQLGLQLLDLSGGDATLPFWSMAAGQFDRADQLGGNSALPMQGLIMMHAMADRPVETKYWKRFRMRATHTLMGPETLNAIYRLVECKVANTCALDANELQRTLDEMLQRNPGSAALHTIYANFAWNALDDRSLAVALERKAVMLAPRDASFKIALAKFLLASTRQTDRAEGAEILKIVEAANLDGRFDTEIMQLRELKRNGGTHGSDD